MSIVETRPEIERFIQQCQVVSTEAFGNEGIADVVTNHLPKLTATLKDAFRFVTTWDYSRPEVINVGSVSAKLRRVRYTDLESVNVAKPVGFMGNLHDYVASLQAQRLQYLTGMADSVLGHTTKNMAYYLNTLENLQERRVGNINAKYDTAILASLVEEEGRWLVEGNRSSEAPFTDLYDNNTDCRHAMELMNDINLQRWKHANPKDIARRVSELKEVAETLLTTINERDVSVSKQVVRKIADELELTARWVEWYSVMQTRIIDTTTALKHQEKTLVRVL